MLYDLAKHGISQSMIKDFLSCRRRFELKATGWERSATSEGEAMLFGNVFHKLQEIHYTKPEKLPPEKFAQKYFEAYLEKHPSEYIDPTKLSITLQVVWRHYVEFWKKFDTSYTWSFMEKVFDVTFAGVRLRGKIDGGLKIKGKLWHFETKTSSAIPTDEVLGEYLMLDFQNQFYIVASPDPIVGVLYNYIRFPKHKFNDPDDYRKNIDKSISKDPSLFFMRYQIPYLPQTIKRFKEELAAILYELKLVCTDELPCFKNTASCIGRGYCSYMRMCSSNCFEGYSRTRRLFRELEDDA